MGDLWSDTTANLLKRCTSVSPITFVSVEGGSAAHALFSATHGGDVNDADTPADNEVLTFDAGTGRWNAEPASGHGSHIVSGDDHAQSHALTGADHTVSGLTDGQVLKATGATTFAFEDDAVVINFIIDGGGAVISVGEKGHIEVPFAMTITGWTILADQSGSIVVDVWKDTYANFPPTNADSIAGTEKPTLSAAQKNQDLSLTSWTTSVAAGDILAFEVESASTVQRVVVALRGKKT